MIPNYQRIPRHLHRGYHGKYPQAAKIACNEGLKSGSREWWARIREILAHWHNTDQI